MARRLLQRRLLDAIPAFEDPRLLNRVEVPHLKVADKSKAEASTGAGATEFLVALARESTAQAESARTAQQHDKTRGGGKVWGGG